MEIFFQTKQFYYNFGDTRIDFEENVFGGFTPVLQNEDSKPLTDPPQRFFELIQNYNEDSKKIRDRCGNDLSSLTSHPTFF